MTDAKKPPRRKGGKNIVMIAAILGMLAMVVVVLVFNGADLGQSKVDKEAKAKAKEAQAKVYQQKIQNPAAATKESFYTAKVQLEHQRAARAQADMVPPFADASGAVPMPPVNAYNMERYKRAQAAIERDSGKSTHGSNSPAEPSFVMYQSNTGGAESSSLSNPLDALKLKGAVKPQSGASAAQEQYNKRVAAQDPQNDAQYQRAQAQIAAFKAQQTASGQKAPSVGGANATWLYQAQNDAVKDATGNIVATKTKALYWLAPGTSINAVLLNAVNTLLPGRLVARVTQNIYDSRYGKYLVIPAGSLLEGQYNSSVQDGQDRVLMAFDTLVTPAGGTVALGNMSAGDALGRAGLKGTLHTHFWERMGISTLLAFEAVGMDKLAPTQTTISAGGSTTSPAADGAQIIVNTANQELQRMYSVKPNITMPAGQPMSIITTGGIEVPPIANAR